MTTGRSCLFTGELLEPTTKPEHVIPEGICGRIKSRRVTSSDFNQRCGNWCDPQLVEGYKSIVLSLDTLLPKRLRLGGIDAAATADIPSIIRMRSGWRPQLTKHLEDEKSIIATHEHLEKLACHRKDIDISTKKTISIIEAIGQEVDYESPTINPHMVVGAAKAILCTLDYVLLGTSYSFCRDGSTLPLRTLIKDSVYAKDTNCALWDSFFLGMQYDYIGQIHKAMLDIGFNKNPEEDFSHVIIVTGNTAKHAIHAVFLVFGHDPWGFILSREWYGPDFTVVLNQKTVLSNQDKTLPWTRYIGEHAVELCAPSIYKPWSIEEVDAQDIEIISERISERRNTILHRIISTIETGEDIRDDFMNLCDLLINISACPTNLIEVFFQRIQLRFNQNNLTEEEYLIEKQYMLNHAVTQEFGLDRGILSSSKDIANFSNDHWLKYLQVYQDTVGSMIKKYGVPKIFKNKGCHFELRKKKI